MEWLTSGGMDAIVTLVGLALAIVSTVLTKVMKKPESPVLSYAIKSLGVGAFKDEDANWSVPVINKNIGG